jgi:hypothetical protein
MIDGNGSMQSLQPGIVLRRLQNDAQNFTDSIVYCLAEQIGAHVITLDVDDMDDLCWEFLEQGKTGALEHASGASAEAAPAPAPANVEGHDQGKASEDSPTQEDSSNTDSESPDLPDPSATCKEFEALDAGDRSHPTMFYFGTQSERKSPPERLQRTRAAWSALIHGLQLKVEDVRNHVSKVSIKDQTDSLILLYVPDSDAFTNLSVGRRFFTRMRDFIKAQRVRGQRIAMVLSVNHSSTPKNCQCDSCIEAFSYSLDRVNRKLQIDAVTKFKVPWQSEEGLKTREQGGERESWMKESNMRKIKISLRSELPKNLKAVCLERTAVWDFPVAGKALDFMTSRLLSNEEVQKATRQIIGRCWHKGIVDTEDIFAVLARVFDQLSKHRDDENEDTEPQVDEKSAWETKRDTIHDDCNDFEQRLLSGVVDPGMLTLLF